VLDFDPAVVAKVFFARTVGTPRRESERTGPRKK
jgi:hypothetical protein